MKRISFLVFILGVCTCLYAQSGSIDVNDDFSEREVMIHTSYGDLYGTLVIPIDNKIGIVTLIIPDFGLTDRNGNRHQATGGNSIKMLAEDLAKEGISSLRIEKRGVTESKKSPMVRAGVRIEDMVEDAVSWLRFLKTDKRFKKVAVVGHGEGALVGMLASEITDVKYYISIAGFGRPGYEQVEENLVSLLTTEQMDTARLYIEELKKGYTIENIALPLASVFNPNIQTYLASWFKYNPAVEIIKIDAKVLLVQGTSDLQVNSGELVRLVSAYPKAEELIVEGMDHTLKLAKKEEGQGPKAANNLDTSLAGGLVEGIANFLKH